MSTTRPSAKQHNSDSKRLDSAKATGDDGWDSEGSDDDQEEVVEDDGQKGTQVEQIVSEYESDETTDEDDEDDEEEHLVIKTKGSKAPPNKRVSMSSTAKPPTVERVSSRTDQGQPQTASRPQGNRSRSRSRTRLPNPGAAAANAHKTRRKSSARRQSHVDHDHGKTGVFARTKSQIGFDVHGNGEQQDHVGHSDESDSEDRYEAERAPAKESQSINRSAEPAHETSNVVQEVVKPGRTISAGEGPAPAAFVASPKSVLNLEDDENKPGFPFPALDGQVAAVQQRLPSDSAKSARQGPSHHNRRDPGLQMEKAVHSPNGSDSQTLVGSNASPGRAETPRMTASSQLPSSQPGQSPAGNVPSTPPANPPTRKHVRTRNSHTSLRSLASMRLAGPPPHPLTSPGGAKSRVTSLSGRSGPAIAAPQLNREVARGLCSTSPTESMISNIEVVGRNGSHGHGHGKHSSTPPSQVARTGSQRSLRDYFGLPSSAKTTSRDSERGPDMSRKTSFSSITGAGLPRASSSSALNAAGLPSNQGGSSRLSAHSVAQAAARLPSTANLSASAYGDRQAESSQVGLISRFLTPSSWNPKALVASSAKDRHGKSRANTAPGYQSDKPSVFPPSPFAAAHASLVRTLMEDGSKLAPQGGHHGPSRGSDRMRSDTGPVPRASAAFSSLALTPAHNDDGSRGRGYGKEGKNGNRDKEMVLVPGLTPFEMSVSRCLEQRKNAVRLKTGGPLGPLPP